jgi:hypothetical protein
VSFFGLTHSVPALAPTGAPPATDQVSRPASVISSTAQTLVGSTVPADLIAAMNVPARSATTGIVVPDGTHRFSLDDFLADTASGLLVEYAAKVPLGKTLTVEVWKGALTERAWQHVGASDTIITAAHDVSDLQVQGAGYEVWFTVA